MIRTIRAISTRPGTIVRCCHIARLGSPDVKKGRHRRFEEARKLKQSGPAAFDLGLGEGPSERPDREPSEDDEYAALAEKYGVTFDDEDDTVDD